MELLCGLIYAISDEIHQLFINGREGKIQDVLIDEIGVLIGIVVLLFIIEIIKKIKGRNKEQ